MRKKSVCYVLSYYSPRYIRTEALIKALQELDGIDLYQARNSTISFWRYFQTLWKLVVVRLEHNPDFYILGFRGYEFFWLVRLVTLGKILIFDHMMSPYDSLMSERNLIEKNGALSRLIYFYEKSILWASDLILTDTEMHKNYFCKLFNLSLGKIEVIPVGADETFFESINSLSKNNNSLPTFEVLYYGSFLPLHGIDVILSAASILKNKLIHFTLIGGNNRLNFKNILLKFDLSNVSHIDWVDFENLKQLINEADLGLGGPFGNTGQANRVITGKTLQFLAMSKPVIVGEGPHLNGGFEDKVNCLLVPQKNGQALANAILWAFDNNGKLNQIGRQGNTLYHSRYSIKQISEKMKRVLSI